MHVNVRDNFYFIDKNCHFDADNSSSCEIAKIYGTDVSSRASPSDCNQFPFPVDMSDQPQPSTSRDNADGSCESAGLGRPDVDVDSPTPCSSRRRSSSSAAWPPRPITRVDSDDDEEDTPVTYSSQVDYQRDAMMTSPTDNCRDKQPVTMSLSLIHIWRCRRRG